MNFSRFLKYWLPVLVWIAVIFIGSSDLMSAERTSRLLVPLLLWLKRDITAEAIAQIHFLLRKCAHLTEYGILAIILWRAIDRGTDLTIKISMLYMSLFFAAALIAGADEFYQSFKSSRTASTGDVLIDIIGAMIGLAICFALGVRKNLQKI